MQLWKKFWKSVNIYLRYGRKHRGPFFDSQCSFQLFKLHCKFNYRWIGRSSTDIVVQQTSYCWPKSAWFKTCRTLRDSCQLNQQNLVSVHRRLWYISSNSCIMAATDCYRVDKIWRHCWSYSGFQKRLNAMKLRSAE
jgi:hypothetical protein